MKASLRFYVFGLLIATITGWSTYSIVLGQPPQRAVDALRAAEATRLEAEQFDQRSHAFEDQPDVLLHNSGVNRSRADVVIERTIRTELKKLQGDATAEEKQSVQKSLVKNVGLLFDLRQKQRESELDAMEKELKRLREVHVRRDAEKDKIVNDRVQQLIREREGLGWGNAPGRHSDIDWTMEVAMPPDFIKEFPVAPEAPTAVSVPVLPRPSAR